MNIPKVSEILKGKYMTQSNDEEPYILTEEEEKIIISNAISRIKEHKEWVFKNEMNLPDEEIRVSMAKINFEEKINKAEILSFANSCKHQDIWQKERRKKEKEDAEKKAEEIRKSWTAERMFSLMKYNSQYEFDKKLIVNENNKHLITALCFFISEDKRFETDLGYSFKKGILIRGTVGLGKTFLTSCIRDNELNPVAIISMLEIADEVRSEGEYVIKMGANRILYLDDVGTEEATVNHYGTRINFFKQFIEGVYLRNRDFNKLIISTNNSFSEIEEKYGFRVRSRIKDMFNIIDIKGEDMRGKV